MAPVAASRVASLTPPRERPPGAPLTVRTAVGAASARLHARGMATPWLDAAVLLAHAIGVSKERLFAVYPEPLPEDARLRFERLLARRESTGTRFASAAATASMPSPRASASSSPATMRSSPAPASG